MQSSTNNRKRFRQLFQRKVLTTKHSNSNTNLTMPLYFGGSSSPCNINISQNSNLFKNSKNCSLNTISSARQTIKKKSKYAPTKFINNLSYDENLKSFYTENQNNQNENQNQKQIHNPFIRKKNKYITNINGKLRQKLQQMQSENIQPIDLNQKDLKVRLRLENDYQKGIFQRVQIYKKNQDYTFKCRQQLLLQKLVKKRNGINQSTEQYKRRNRKFHTMENSPKAFKNSEQSEKQLKLDNINLNSKNDQSKIPYLNFKSSQKDDFLESMVIQNQISSRRRVSQSTREPIINFSAINNNQATDCIKLQNSRNNIVPFPKNSQAIDQQLKSLREEHKRLKTSRQKSLSQNEKLSSQFSKILSDAKKDSQKINEAFYKESNMLLQSQLLLSNAKNTQMQEKIDIMSKMIKNFQIKVTSLESQKNQLLKKNNQLIQNILKKKEEDKKYFQDSFNSSFNLLECHNQISTFDKSKNQELDCLEKMNLVFTGESNKIKAQDTPRFLLNNRKYSQQKNININEKKVDKVQQDSLLLILNNTNNSNNSNNQKFLSSGQPFQGFFQTQPQFNNFKLFSYQGKTQHHQQSQPRDSKSSDDMMISNILDDIKNLKRKDISDALEQICNEQNERIFTLQNIPLEKQKDNNNNNNDKDKDLSFNNKQKPNHQNKKSFKQELLEKQFYETQNSLKEQQQLISSELKDFMKQNQTLKNQILTLQSKLQFQIKKIQFLQNQSNSFKIQIDTANQKQTFYQEQILNMKDVLDKMKNTNKNLFAKIKEINSEKQKIEEICHKMHEEYIASLQKVRTLKKVNEQLEKQKINLEQAISQFKQINIKQWKNIKRESNETKRSTQSQTKLYAKSGQIQGQKSVQAGSDSQSKKIQNYDVILSIFGVNPDTINHNQVLMKKIVLFQNNIIKITKKLQTLQQHISHTQKQQYHLKQQNSMLQKKIRELSSFYQQTQQITNKTISQNSNENTGQSFMNQSLKEGDSLFKHKSYVFKSLADQLKESQKQQQEVKVEEDQDFQEKDEILQEKQQKNQYSREQDQEGSIGSLQINDFLNK